MFSDSNRPGPIEASGRRAYYHSGMLMPGSHDGAIYFRYIYLKAEELFVTNEPCMVKTVLGSCVSVFLWDPALKVGGVNHYSDPKWDGKDTPTNKYGDVAIRNLIKGMIALGSRAKEIYAKVFGGDKVLETDKDQFLHGREILPEPDVQLLHGNCGH